MILMLLLLLVMINIGIQILFHPIKTIKFVLNAACVLLLFVLLF